MMHQEPKQRLIKITREQFKELMARHGDIDVPHFYIGPLGTYWVRRAEWEAFQSISGGEHDHDRS